MLIGGGEGTLGWSKLSTEGGGFLKCDHKVSKHFPPIIHLLSYLTKPCLSGFNNNKRRILFKGYYEKQILYQENYCLETWQIYDGAG